MKIICIGLIAGALGCAFFQPAAEAAKWNILYSFCAQVNCADGAHSMAGLVDVNGILYGTTSTGGASRYDGTVFSLDPNTGKETVLHSFCSQQGCADGDEPFAGLINVNGTLYGTTLFGGASNHGAVFSLDPATGKEKVIYSFCSQQNCADGAWPYDGLIYANGSLYGTTYMGGTSGQCNVYGCGAVFAVNLNTGKEKALYSFCPQQGCADGLFPHAGLINVQGTLYGTTAGGGANSLGTVFAIDRKTGAETVVYSFQGGGDGYQPYSALIDTKGTLYGTTLYGGAGNCSAFLTDGCGTVFSVNPATRAETVLHSFRNNGTDGIYPYAGVFNVNGTLYGTTANGGIHDDSGIVFALKKP